MILLRLIRWPNLLIVGLTQALLYYRLLVPAFENAKLPRLLDDFHFFLLIVSTLLIAAGGYIINDIVDYETDMINKPEKVIVQRLLGRTFVWNLYYASIVVGLLLSLYLANHVQNLPLVLLFPSAVFLLWCYSVRWKKQVLVGNITVAIFCAFVAGIVLFAERNTYNQLLATPDEMGQQLTVVFAAYLAFAFLSTMFREIVKDAEDVVGDQHSDCQTLPVVYGVSKAKLAAAIFGILLLLAVFAWTYLRFSQNQYLEVAYLTIAIIIPTKIALFLLDHAEDKNSFKRLSRLAKYLMLSGILYLLVFSY